ncbi:hypothetical protein T12_10519 [Trichinella patagoniensis]|uniref:Uncharacterized protein n=1 Tax=Trichinella patagoniensis TaxID=990121 RepID=A0A0V0ZER9_9BILA|nr:hypothetical protein T12_10519 [Trichinella patagoniensis]
MLGCRVNWKPCSNISSKSSFQPQKFRFGTLMVCLCGPTTIWKGKTVTVVWQIDDGYTHGRGSVRRSAAYGVQQRRVAVITVCLCPFACGEKQKYLCAKQSAISIDVKK